MPSLQGILFIPTHAFVISVQINHFYDFRYDYPMWHLVKMINSRINNYKPHMQLILVINVDLDENEKYIYIINFYRHPKNR
jgi:hypothetical protein